ncbi:uncharacterized protein LOC120358940 [Solenopsis invicta]|uniref:uncharacterized protein LOC120358940 n=1 Tax=Solenopsis invicta TaxID=13686 RepID=UPI00193DC4FB|nr:uncharacterized protein LOC120358940 [Solenopsis invicta]
MELYEFHPRARRRRSFANYTSTIKKSDSVNKASFKHPIKSSPGHSRSFYTCEGMSIGGRRVDAYFQSGPEKSPKHLRIGPVLSRLKCRAIQQFVEDGFSR